MGSSQGCIQVGIAFGEHVNVSTPGPARITPRADGMQRTAESCRDRKVSHGLSRRNGSHGHAGGARDLRQRQLLPEPRQHRQRVFKHNALRCQPRAGGFEHGRRHAACRGDRLGDDIAHRDLLL
jgi:hypothetical protein